MSSVTAVPLLPIKKGSVRRLWLAVILVIAIAAVLAWNGTRSFGSAAVQNKEGVTGHIAYEIIKPGSEEHPVRDSTALLNYRGKLADGSVFDASQQPAPMPLENMIPGFAEAVTKVGKGGHLRVRIPPELGYGSQASDKIPANSTLYFDIEVLDFVSREQWQQIQQAQMQQMLQQQMQQGGGAGGAGGPPLPQGVPQP